MNLANRLTMLRMLLSSAMFAALMFPNRYCHVAALAFYIAAVVTDWFDGYVARKTNTISAFGKIADPIADKILVLGALIALLRNREFEIPLWGVFLILARELLLGGLRTLAAVQGKILAAERWGKWKMGIQSVSVLLMLAILVLCENRGGLPAWIRDVPYHLTLISVIATWASAYLYYRQTHSFIESSWS